MPLFAIFFFSFSFFYKNTLGLQASEGTLLCAAFFFHLVRILWAYKLLRVPYCVLLFFSFGKNTLGLQASKGALLCAAFFFF